MFKLDDPETRQFLTNWFGDGPHQFGQFRNVYCNTLDEIIQYMKRSLLEGMPAFHSVQPTLIISKMFWEFDTKAEAPNYSYDSSVLDSVWEQTLKLCSKVEEKKGKPLITYSGRRGYHVWSYAVGLKFEATQEKEGTKVYKDMLLDILGNADDYPDFDTHPTSINSMARIPFSFHQKSFNQVVPLTKDRKPYMPNLREFADNPIDRDYFLSMFRKALNKIQERKDMSFRFANDIPRQWTVRPCITEALTKNPTHSIRLAYLLDLIFSGATDAQIHDEYKKFGTDKYDETLTQYQIDYARNKRADDGILPVSSSTLKLWKVCDEDKCKACGHCGNRINPWEKKK